MATMFGLRGLQQRPQPVRGVVSWTHPQLHRPQTQQQQPHVQVQRNRFSWIVLCSAESRAGTQAAVQFEAEPGSPNSSKAVDEQQQWEAEIEETLKLVRLLPHSGEHEPQVESQYCRCIHLGSLAGTLCKCSRH